MKQFTQILFFLALPLSLLQAYTPPAYPFAPAAGQAGSTAIAYDDPRIRSWASSIESVVFGEDVDAAWQDPVQQQAALGPAGTDVMDVLVLGRGGVAVLGFAKGVRNGDGPDFSVFENGLSDNFLELAFVEVSSDGIHFIRFPGYSYTEGSVCAFCPLNPANLHGLASKYRLGFGTPFDLQDLEEAYLAVQSGYTGFSAEYADSLLENYPYLDLEKVKFIRLVDIPGDGTVQDCQGFTIFDPYTPQSVASAGFDLDAIGVLNESLAGSLPYGDWCIGFGVSPDPESDSDGDGWAQLLEYLLASDPTDPGSRPVLSRELSKEGLRLTYTRNLSAGGAAVLQAMSGTGQWAPALADVSTVSVHAAEGYVYTVEQVALPLYANGLFLRFAGSLD